MLRRSVSGSVQALFPADAFQPVVNIIRRGGNNARDDGQVRQTLVKSVHKRGRVQCCDPLHPGRLRYLLYHAAGGFSNLTGRKFWPDQLKIYSKMIQHFQ